MNISGRNVIVTGGGRGMGRQFALDFKELGAKPYVLDVVQENLDTLERETGIPGKVVDVTDEEQVVSFFEDYVAENGAPDVLINNAGITADSLFIKKKEGEVAKFPMDKFRKVLEVNLVGVFLCGREAAYHMVRSEKPGVIVNISSISRAGNVGQTNYAATKAAVVAMTVTWAKELARHGIRAGAIAPGYINTEMVAQIREDVRERLVSTIPLRRLGEMTEISQAAQFIVRNEFFTGRVLEVDGGMRL